MGTRRKPDLAGGARDLSPVRRAAGNAGPWVSDFPATGAESSAPAPAAMPAMEFFIERDRERTYYFAMQSRFLRQSKIEHLPAAAV
jgi:hypothetical protein